MAKADGALTGKLIVFCADGEMLGPFDTYGDAIQAAHAHCRGGAEDYEVRRLADPYPFVPPPSPGES